MNDQYIVGVIVRSKRTGTRGIIKKVRGSGVISMYILDDAGRFIYKKFPKGIFRAVAVGLVENWEVI